MTILFVGIDLAKSVFALHGVDEHGKAVLVASHSLSEVEITADRIIIMGKGRVLTDASRTEVLALGSGPRRLESAYLAITRTSVDYVAGGSGS